MILSTYLKQILSLSNVVERVQQSLQSRGEDSARQFSIALRDEIDRKRTEPHQVEGPENGIIRKEQSRPRFIFRRIGGRRWRGRSSPEEESIREESLRDEVAKETKQGENVDLEI